MHITPISIRCASFDFTVTHPAPLGDAPTADNALSTALPLCSSAYNWPIRQRDTLARQRFALDTECNSANHYYANRMVFNSNRAVFSPQYASPAKLYRWNSWVAEIDYNSRLAAHALYSIVTLQFELHFVVNLPCQRLGIKRIQRLHHSTNARTLPPNTKYFKIAHNDATHKLWKHCCLNEVVVICENHKYVDLAFTLSLVIYAL